MTQPQPPAGWFPDPSDPSRLRYFDGKVWTEQYAVAANPAPTVLPPPVPPVPAQLSANPAKKPLNWKLIGLVGAAFLAVIVLANVAGNDKKSTVKSSDPSYSKSYETRTAQAGPSGPLATPSTTAKPAPPPPGSVAPEGVRFQTQDGPQGQVVVADFDIGDAVFMYLTKFGARSTTKEILQYVKNKYPQASSVEVQGKFPTKDAYGNSQKSVVVDVFYTRATLDKINFAGIDNDKVWAVRDGGTIHPDLED